MSRIQGSRDHKLKGERNLELESELADIFGNEYRDWLATAGFYAAVHFVDAFVKQINPGINYKTHDERKAEFHRVIDGETYNRYKAVESLAREARYDYIEFPQYDEQTRAEMLNFIERRLKPFS